MADYQVIQVRAEDLIGDEALGSKTKFWFRHDAKRWLFKEARDGTGEDWAEKIAAHVAMLVGIPAATVELAEFEGRRGCACLSFVHPEHGETLVHGNEILAGIVLGYDPKKTFHQSDHTLDNIATAIDRLFTDKAAHDAVLGILASYLVLDALVGNTDRHHENWALLVKATQADGIRVGTEVAPSFDHASSLGRELNDLKRQNLLKADAVGSYARKGKGAIYFGTADQHGANPIRLVEFGARRFPQHFMPPLQRLKGVAVPNLQGLVDAVPVARMSDSSKQFARAFLAYTHNALTILVK